MRKFCVHRNKKIDGFQPKAGKEMTLTAKEIWAVLGQLKNS